MTFFEVKEKYSEWHIICHWLVGNGKKDYLPLAVYDDEGDSIHKAYDDVRDMFPEYNDSLTPVIGDDLEHFYRYNMS